MTIIFLKGLKHLSVRMSVTFNFFDTFFGIVLLFSLRLCRPDLALIETQSATVTNEGSTR